MGSKSGMYLSFLVILCYLIIIILNGTRDEVGTDYSHYKWVFDIAQRGEVYAIVEPGYWLINTLFVKFEHGYRYVFALMCALTYLNLFLIAKEEKVLPVLIPFLFSFGFIFFSNNIIRQSFAITLFIYSIRFIEQKKFWRYFLSVMIIFLFHTSALLLIPFYWIGRIRLSKSYWIIAIFGSIILYKLNIFHNIIRLIASLIPKYSAFIGLAGHDEFRGGFGLSIILLIILGISVALFAEFVQKNRRHSLYFNLFMMGVCFSIMLFSSAYFYRFTFYLFYIVLLLIPIILKNIEKVNFRRITFVYFFLFSLMWWIKALLFNDGEPLPYQSFLF
ncbi:EpsG family protein [Plebeiibacterium marinum]|uniref:EpsG family protein n=1 Tax=Plebeiibacterium marinum TaxID=2992111 RepID=A0AAE3MDX0_9BACT|nr:EpsG family protein [Plebeiobacterium marinum]MCW3805815.1 EpsG family protein [Plebeiobacterium marinum]